MDNKSLIIENCNGLGMEIKCLFVVLMVLFACISKISAQSYQLTTYQTEQGLAANVTKAIVRDKLGFIWIASDEGVSRFDGKKFINFKKELPSNYTKSLFITKKSQILVANDLGILQIESKPDTSIFKTLLYGTSTMMDANKIMYPKEIFEDCAGNLWMSEPNSVLQYKKGKTKRYPFPQKMNTTVYLRSFHFAELACHRLFVASFKGFLMYFDAQKDAFVELAIPKGYYLNDISAVLAMDKETLWIGEANGVVEIKINEKNEIASAKRIVSVKSVSYLTKDNKGKVLLGTWNNGLYQIERNNEKFLLQKIKESKATVINHILVDIENNIWISSDDGIELLKPNTFTTLAINEQNSYIEDLFLASENSLLVCDGSFIHEITKKEKSYLKKTIYNYPQSNIHAVAKINQRLYVGTGDAKLIAFENGFPREINLNKFGGSVFSLFADRNQNIWVCQYGREQGVLKVAPDFSTVFYTTGRGIDSLVYVVREDEKGNIYCGSKGKTSYLYQYEKTKDRFVNISIPIVLKTQTEFIINDLVFDKSAHIWLASSQGLWRIRNKKIELIDLGKKYSSENITALWIDASENMWIGTKSGVIKYKNGQIVLYEKVNGLSTVTISPRGIVENKDGNLFVATANGLNYLEEKDAEIKITPSPIFLTFKAQNKKIDLSQKEFSFGYFTTLDISFLAFTYPNHRVLYQYRILGLQLHEEWSEASDLNQITIERIPNGNYTLEIRAKQQGNYNWSLPLTLKFEVRQAFYWTPIAIIFYLVLLVAIFWVGIQFYTARLKSQREILTYRIHKATEEIAMRAENLREANTLLLQQKEEINQQKENIEKQKETIESAYKIIERNSQKILDSIRYAKTIQQIILPPEHILQDFFKDYFLIYKPKDMVSGDFYWALKIENKIFVAVVDCTGHGVPGAFMSMIGHTLLYRIIKLKGVYQPARILELLHLEIRIVLKQKQSNNLDGMDMCICVLERIENKHFEPVTKVVFTGARRPLYYFANDSLEILDGDRKAIGGQQIAQKSFQSQALILHEGDAIYLTTDGLVDQNNIKRKKFGENQFSRLLEKNARLKMREQKQIIEKALENHQEGTEQRDDITILGIRI